MATAELKQFLEDRLLTIMPDLDLSAGSPAQTQFISPVISYLGTDPFATDIDSFLTDRFSQEFPDVFAGDPGAARDLFIKPTIVFFEPIKREIQSIKRGRSLKDPSLLSDADADALVANVFVDRDPALFSTGEVRVYYPNPNTVQVDTSIDFSTASGLNFFPTAPISISAEQMVFNREGALYFVDVPLKAEKAGAEYNIPAGSGGIVKVSGLYGSVKVRNLRAFQNGTTKITTPALVAQASEELTERSLTSPRGTNALLRKNFQGDLRAVQVIGAGDAEMERDILSGTSPGHAWMTGRVTLYKNVALVQARTIDASDYSPPVPGDQLYAYLDPFSYDGRWASLAQEKRFLRLTVEEMIGPRLAGANGYQASYLVRFSGLPNTLVTPLVLEGGFIRKGSLQISSLPTFGSVDLNVKDQDVHLFGHIDVYLRPVLQSVSTAIFSSVQDEQALVERLRLHTYSDQNYVSDVLTDVIGNVTEAYDFVGNGVLPGDLLTIENGDDAGTYPILEVTPSSTFEGRLTPSRLYISAKLSKDEANLRYRVMRSMTVDLFEPKIQKLPFGANLAKDLQTTIGSKLFALSGTNAIDYAVKVGDTLRILEGLNAGDYTVTGFDATLGGRGLIMDRAAGTSAADVAYEVFTTLDPVERPLVRVRELLVLDSSRKSTGISVPPADPVALVPTSNFTTARVRGSSATASGFVLPAMRDLVDAVNASAANGDRRYSMGFDSVEDGVFKAMLFDGTSLQAELLIPDDSMDECCYFLMTPEDFNKTENFPPVEPREGDALNIRSGPNKGGYLVSKVRKFKYQLAGGKSAWVYFVKIHGTFPVDVFGQLFLFFQTNLVSFTKLTGSSPIAFPGFFSSLYSSLGGKIGAGLLAMGAPSPGAPILQTAAQELLQVGYDVGDPARGVLRSYFLSPTLFQQNTAESDNPTIYEYETASGDVIRFRPDPLRYDKHEMIPARGLGDSDPKSYPRDITLSGSVSTLSMVDRASVYRLGLMLGDILSLHEEVFFAGDATKMSAVQTFQGQAKVVAPAGVTFSEDHVGNLLAIEEGDDAGVYRVTDFVDDKTLLLDRPLGKSTPSAILAGSNAQWGLQGGKNVVVDATANFTGACVNKWLTVFAISARSDGIYYQGSFRVSEVPNTTTLVLDRSGMGDFPAFPQAGACYVLTDAPSANLTQVSGQTGVGTELFGLRPFRMYQGVASDYPIANITLDPTFSQFTVEGSPVNGHKQPFRIYRSNIRRVNPMEMSENQDGAFYYFDTEVVSLSPLSSSNIVKDSYLTVKDGTFKSWGYRHKVGDRTLTYSMKETGSIVLPTRLLPSFSTDSEDNFILLVGTPVQVSYEKADVVVQVQEFMKSGEDRSASANLLARHFLPAYVSYDAQYSGGSSPSVITQDIIDYINTLPVETPLDVSVLQDLIDKRGGNPVTPTKASITIHDWSRKAWVEFSEDELGGMKTKVPYDGTPRVSYFVPGDDASGQSVTVGVERVSLRRG
jgi:hypothetical protein